MLLLTIGILMKTNHLALPFLAFLFLSSCSTSTPTASLPSTKAPVGTSTATNPPASPTVPPAPTPSPTAKKAAGQPPPGCVEADLVYDPQLQHVLLVNCFSQTSSQNQTVVIWSWNGQSWDVVDDQGPEGRLVTGAAYDVKRGVLVLYGGQPLTSTRCTRDTWEWDHQGWAKKDANSPAPCDHFKMVYSAAQEAVLLFGGQDEQQRLLDETWNWDGQVWQKVSDSGPASRAHFGFVYDNRHEQALLYGGFTGNVYDDFWSWRDGAWQQIHLPGPGKRSHLGMAFDEESGVLLIFGGAKGGSTLSSLTDETWVLNNGAWSQQPGPAPSPRGSPAMAYDPERKRIVLYGGFPADQQELADTWEWDGQAWACLANCL